MITVLQEIKLDEITFSNDKEIVILGGINVIEDEVFALKTAEIYKAISEKLNIKIVFKASYDKANRSSIHSFRGPGLKQGLKILEKIKSTLDIPIISDVHSPEEAIAASKVLDIIQLPAFLARQTDLVAALASTGRIINIKKPQFLSPLQIKNIINKFHEYGNDKLLICERGTNFGYDNLVVDMLGFGLIKRECNNIPLIFDVTHSLQCRVENSEVSSGRRKQAFELASAAVATRIAGLFIECHPNPDLALCDGSSALPLDLLESFLINIIEIDKIVKNQRKIEIV